ncbi:MAG: hypothetical protein LIP77_11690 [Planctomycetes bacterium]|nr:hypothetical protein [Planctomycetota bacterium]
MTLDVGKKLFLVLAMVAVAGVGWCRSPAADVLLQEEVNADAALLAAVLDQENPQQLRFDAVEKIIRQAQGEDGAEPAAWLLALAKTAGAQVALRSLAMQGLVLAECVPDGFVAWLVDDAAAADDETWQLAAVDALGAVMPWATEGERAKAAAFLQEAAAGGSPALSALALSVATTLATSGLLPADLPGEILAAQLAAGDLDPEVALALVHAAVASGDDSLTPLVRGLLDGDRSSARLTLSLIGFLGEVGDEADIPRIEALAAGEILYQAAATRAVAAIRDRTSDQ